MFEEVVGNLILNINSYDAIIDGRKELSFQTDLITVEVPRDFEFITWM